MSLARRAAGSFVWATGASLAARLFSVVSTFLLTRYLSPAVQGEVNLAFVFVASAGIATALGVTQYVAAHPAEDRDSAFHGTVLVLGAGLLSCLFCLAAGRRAAALLGTPHMAVYIPGLVAAHWLDRCAWVPRGILVRQMRFRSLGLRLAVGELVFATSSVGLAHLGLGGHAIVGANVARSAVSLLLVLHAAGAREPFAPRRLSGRTFRRILSFGVPMTVAQFFRRGASTWDNSLMGYRFGEAAVGIYNQAYRLADLPASAVGDPLNDVLVPTFARLPDPEARRRGFLRAAGLLGLLVLPMAAGLSVTASSLVVVFYPPSYAGVAPFLAILALIGVARAFTSLSGAFLQATGRTSRYAINDFTLVVGVLGSMALLSHRGPVAAVAGVTAAFYLNTLLALRCLRPEGITIRSVLAAAARPLCATIPMVAAVAAARLGLRALRAGAGLSLALEIACGMVVYAAAACLFARALVRDLLALARGTMGRGPSSRTRGAAGARPRARRPVSPGACSGVRGGVGPGDAPPRASRSTRAR